MRHQPTLAAILFSVALVAALLLNTWSARRAHIIALDRVTVRDDYSKVNSIHNGLLSVTVWSNELKRLATTVITDFSFSALQETQLRAQIDGVLNAMITEAQSLVNNPRGLKGGVQKVAVNLFVDWDKLREKVPQFTQVIMDEFNKPQNRDQIKTMLRDKLSAYAAQTHDAVSDSARIDSILNHYSSETVEVFNRKTAVMTSELTEKTYRHSLPIMGTMIAFLLLWLLVYKRPRLHRPLFISSVILAFIALFIGLTAPMIEIDARLNSVNFTMLGQDMLFKDQIIFFQSKSIMDIVQILLTTGKADSMLVGMLLLTFSILFPVTKLAATVIYMLGRPSLQAWKPVRFFAFKSGKWSMADVFCLAIFMAYVGFNGILDDQMKDLNVESGAMTSLATNLTSLQPGFIMFVSFVLFALILSEVLKRIVAREASGHPQKAGENASKPGFPPSLKKKYSRRKLKEVPAVETRIM